jgi:hypothetical protein
MPTISGRARLVVPAILVALAVSVSSCSEDYTVTLVNNGGIDLVPYPVVTSPPPPHREADPANAIPGGSSAPIDPGGFNPLYHHADSELGFIVQLALDDDPAQILVVLHRYTVPPGQEGTDPALQPVKLDEKLFEPTKKNITLTFERQGNAFPVQFSES